MNLLANLQRLLRALVFASCLVFFSPVEAADPAPTNTSAIAAGTSTVDPAVAAGAAALAAQMAGVTAMEADSSSIHIVLVGDSTVTNTVGWGKVIPEWLKPGAMCANTSKNGESSKSFYDEGLYVKALALRPAYVLIQFGHNDAKGKGPERETDPATTYKDYLGKYIDEARKVGATPILVTSLARRNFNPDGTLRDEVGPYAAAMKEVAAEKRVPLIDLHERSLEVVKRYGPEACDILGPKGDHTHLSSQGQKIMGKIVVDGLRVAVPDLAPHLKTSLGEK